MLLFVTLSVNNSKNLAMFRKYSKIEVDIMKIKNNQFKIGLTILIISFLLYSYEPSQITANLNNNFNWEWGTIEVVSTESSDYCADPCVAVDDFGNIHVVWEENTNYGGSGTDYDIFYKQWDATSSTWGTTEVVSTESWDSSKDPSLAVDASGNVHVVWEDNTDIGGAGDEYDIFYKIRIASLSTWTVTEEISIFSLYTSLDPSIAIDSIVNIHIVWRDSSTWSGSGLDTDIYYKFWNSSSSSWNISSLVSTESTGASYDPSITIDSSDNRHLVWYDETDYDSNGNDFDIFYKVSNEATFTWSSPQIVTSESGLDSYAPSSVVDVNGNIHVVWIENQGTISYPESNIFYKVWISSVSSWSIAQDLSAEFNILCNRPSVLVDSAENVHVFWDEAFYFMEEPYEVKYKRWETSSSSWTTKEIVSSGIGGGDRTAISASPAIDSLNKIHLVWMDNNDYDGSGLDADILYRMLLEAPIVPELEINVLNFLEYLIISGLISGFIVLPILVSRIRKRNFN